MLGSQPIGSAPIAGQTSSQQSPANAAAWTEQDDTTISAGQVSTSGAATWIESDDANTANAAASISGNAALSESDDVAAVSGTVGAVVVLVPNERNTYYGKPRIRTL